MLYYRLWLAYFRHVVRAVSQRRSPHFVADFELLGREVFSGNHIRKGAKKVKPGLFLHKRSRRRPFSVNRMSLANRSLFMALGRLHGQKRNHTFYGVAQFTAAMVRTVQGDDGWQMQVRGTPSFANPLHADLTIPEDKGKDYDIMIADQLCKIAEFKPA